MKLKREEKDCQKKTNKQRGILSIQRRKKESAPTSKTPSHIWRKSWRTSFSVKVCSFLVDEKREELVVKKNKNFFKREKDYLSLSIHSLNHVESLDTNEKGGKPSFPIERCVGQIVIVKKSEIKTI